jgi:predicted MPP superfamily phosphohydrolase
LSDLHSSPFVPLSTIEHAISIGLAARPDIVCITGDFVTINESFDPAAYTRVLRRVAAAAPTFAVLGNHDGGIWGLAKGGSPDHRRVNQLIEESGIELLHNRPKRLAVASKEFVLTGVGDFWSEEIDGARAFSGVDERLPVILLAHNPDSKDMLPRHPWDLMLSGHTHGGQVLLPFMGPSFAPVVDGRYVAGLKPWGDRQIYVTRGVGNIYGVRFRCRPEVSLLLVG